MESTRREFLLTAALAPLVLWGRRRSSVRPNGTRELRGNTGIYTERGGTIGWYATNEAFVVVDAQFPDTAEHFMAEMRKRRSRDMDMLINTHHHGDHTSGNVYLQQFTKQIVAQEKVPIYQKKRATGTEDEGKQAYANVLFKTEWSVELAGETVSARHFGAGHTAGDAVIHFEKANVVHLGDLVFNNVYPYIDVKNGGASIPGWIAVLETVSKTYPSDAVLIFGHSTGDDDVTGSQEAIFRMRDYLSALGEFVRKEKRSGSTLDELNAKVSFIPGFEKLKERWAGAFRHNLEAAYVSLD